MFFLKIKKLKYLTFIFYKIKFILYHKNKIFDFILMLKNKQFILYCKNKQFILYRKNKQFILYCKNKQFIFYRKNKQFILYRSNFDSSNLFLLIF